MFHVIVPRVDAEPAFAAVHVGAVRTVRSRTRRVSGRPVHGAGVSMNRWCFPSALFVVLSLAVPSAQTRPATAVTTERLRQPPPGEWLTYGLDHAETRFSPLTRITLDNVKHLKSAWTWDIPGGPGQIEATPLVHDGVLYASGTWSVIFALDARTGALKWKWDPGIIRGGRAAGGQTVINGAPNRGVALYNGKVYAGLQDGRLVALDAATGQRGLGADDDPLRQFGVRGHRRAAHRQGQGHHRQRRRRVPRRARLRDRLRRRDRRPGLAVLHRARRSGAAVRVEGDGDGRQDLGRRVVEVRRRRQRLGQLLVRSRSQPASTSAPATARRGAITGAARARATTSSSIPSSP